MFIEDEELRALYQASSAEHLETIESGLMHLEKHPDDEDKLNEVLRSMHSLKGDSRMLGVEDAEKVVHQMEDMLIEVQQGQSTLTAGLCDRLYTGLDATGKIALEAVGGEPANLNLFLVLAGLMSDVEQTTIPDSSPDSTPLVEVTVDTEASDQELQALQESEMLTQARLQFEQQAQEPALEDMDLMDAELDVLLGNASGPEALPSMATTAEDLNFLEKNLNSEEDELTKLLADQGEPILSADVDKTEPQPERKEQLTQIDSIRVSANKLDLLMNQADELTVTKLGIVRRQDDLTQVYRLWEDWSRELSLLNMSSTDQQKDTAAQQVLLRMMQDRLAQLGEALVQSSPCGR